jgi:hypothetical protein
MKETSAVMNLANRLIMKIAVAPPPPIQNDDDNDDDAAPAMMHPDSPGTLSNPTNPKSNNPIVNRL